MGADDDSQARTVAAMHDTAEQLEVAEAILHGSAEESPSEVSSARLHALGDEVTAQAHAIERRADRLAADGSRPAGPGTESPVRG